jgi:hypothetical protein
MVVNYGTLSLPLTFKGSFFLVIRKFQLVICGLFVMHIASITTFPPFELIEEYEIAMIG